MHDARLRDMYRCRVLSFLRLLTVIPEAAAEIVADANTSVAASSLPIDAIMGAF